MGAFHSRESAESNKDGDVEKGSAAGTGQKARPSAVSLTASVTDRKDSKKNHPSRQSLKHSEIKPKAERKGLLDMTTSQLFNVITFHKDEHNVKTNEPPGLKTAELKGTTDARPQKQVSRKMVTATVAPLNQRETKTSSKDLPNKALSARDGTTDIIQQKIAAQAGFKLDPEDFTDRRRPFASTKPKPGDSAYPDIRSPFSVDVRKIPNKDTLQDPGKSTAAKMPTNPPKPAVLLKKLLETPVSSRKSLPVSKDPGPLPWKPTPEPPPTDLPPAPNVEATEVTQTKIPKKKAKSLRAPSDPDISHDQSLRSLRRLRTASGTDYSRPASRAHSMSEAVKQIQLDTQSPYAYPAYDEMVGPSPLKVKPTLSTMGIFLRDFRKQEVEHWEVVPDPNELSQYITDLNSKIFSFFNCIMVC